MSELSRRVGEVIESSTIEFTAQCYELYRSPPLGSLVKTACDSVDLYLPTPLGEVKTAGDVVEQYGIVYNVATTSIEPGRRPIARGKDEATEADIYRSSPQIEKLLRTEFNAIAVGHRQDGKVLYYLPANPPRIHSFVYQCVPEEVAEFSGSFAFLPMLMNARLAVPIEEVASAALRQMSRQAEDPARFLVSAGKELAALLGSDFGRLKAVLGRIQQ